MSRATAALERGRGAEAAQLLLPIVRAGSLNREDELMARAALAEAWLLQDDLVQATAALGRTPDTLREKIPDAQSGLTTFFATPVLRDFIAQGKEVKLRFAGVVSSDRGVYHDRLTLRYTFADVSPPMLITIKRDLISEDETDWQIENVQGESSP